MTLAVLILAASTLITLAHEVGHAFGMKDVYRVDYDERRIVGRVRYGFLPEDWNNGCIAEGVGCERYYASGTMQFEIIGRMLMDGCKLGASAMGADITRGSVHGFDVNGVEGDVETGYFQNPRHVDNPVHR